MMGQRAIDSGADDDSALATRESGIVARASVEHGAIGSSASSTDGDTIDPVAAPAGVEREESPVASAMQSGKDRHDDIDITTDDGDHAGDADAAVIEVSDDEIETAEPLTARAVAPSMVPGSVPAASVSAPFGVLRSRPPARPSLRPRAPNSSALPPPRSWSMPPGAHGSMAPGANGSLPPSSRAGVDPWLLANKTLELSHAQARIAELEEQLAFREARILQLEENLAAARRKLGEAEPNGQRGSVAAFVAPVVGGAAPPVVTETRAAIVAPVDGSLAHRAGANGADADDANEDDDGDDELTGEGERDSGFGTADLRSAGAALDGNADDLQQINGIGPRFEAALRRQGITRLSQIAAWSDADVRQMAKALKIPKSRIVKGRWVEVAREVIGTRVASE